MANFPKRMAVKDSEYHERAKATTWDPAGLLPNEFVRQYAHE